MLHPGIDLLSAFSKDEYDAFRQLVSSLLIYTYNYLSLSLCLSLDWFMVYVCSREA